jgi:hypothetical protein
MSEKLRVFSYSNIDQKLFVYAFTEDELQETATTFHDDIFFMITDAELSAFVTDEVTIVDNLKNDFIYYQPRTTGRCIMLCTCEKFLESDDPTDAGINRLAKKALVHARKTGHTLNPRGN